MVMKAYSSEFKADAVALYLSDPDHTFSSVGQDLGVSRETLRNWVRSARARGDIRSTIRKNVMTSTTAETGEASRDDLEDRIHALEAEVRAVRKENATLAQERDILRKATKFFAGEMNW
jgi:transposase-like protein